MDSRNFVRAFRWMIDKYESETKQDVTELWVDGDVKFRGHFDQFVKRRAFELRRSTNFMHNTVSSAVLAGSFRSAVLT